MPSISIHLTSKVTSDVAQRLHVPNKEMILSPRPDKALLSALTQLAILDSQAQIPPFPL